MQNLEAEIKDAIGLGTTEVSPESTVQTPPEPENTIYSFGRLMEWSDQKPNTNPQST